MTGETPVAAPPTYAPPPMTGRQRCEYIADWIRDKGGPNLTWEDIWYSSSRGELWFTFTYFWEAWAERNGLDASIAGVQRPLEPGQTKGDIVWSPRGESTAMEA